MKFKEFMESPISKFTIFNNDELSIVIEHLNQNDKVIGKTVVEIKEELILFDDFEIIDIKFRKRGLVGNDNGIIITVKESVQDENIQEEENGETGTEQESEEGNSDIRHEGNNGESGESGEEGNNGESEGESGSGEQNP